PQFNYRETFEDREKMLISELSSIYVGCVLKDDSLFTIRANLGIGIIPSLFDCRILLLQDNEKPWAKPVITNRGDLEQLTADGVPDLTTGLGGRATEIAKFYRDALADYPKLSQTVHVTLPDTQGILDLAHTLWGSEIYLAMADSPDLVHKLLQLVTETYIEFSKLQKKVVNDEDEPGWHYHSSCYCKGGVRICDDSATNVSRQMYREFCIPYNQAAFDAFGGGWIHSCGSFQRFLEDMLSLKGLTGVNFGNPERYPLGEYYDKFASRKILINLYSLTDGSKPRDYPFIKTGIMYHIHVPTLEQAKALLTGA
ncbi:MAG: uroporphyrinogen decarboxylase family protein, partial [Planctomycetota bacterium]|nr:uroporphyrinogen decarboxylase family protein [Planctomycetota bacterium]